MRRVYDFCDGWQFTRSDVTKAGSSLAGVDWQEVTLPHTWNAEDGQTRADYHRGRCWYRKSFQAPDLRNGQHAVLKFEAVGQVADVFCNEHLLTTHKGGYSTFFVDLTNSLQPGENSVTVCADNKSRHIYPQIADFTFFGGIYRPVSLLILEENHFSLEKSGSDGVFITPRTDGSVRVDAYVSGGESVAVELLDQLGRPVARHRAAQREGHAVIELNVSEPHHWQGVKDPYLYTAVVTLDDTDELRIRFGFRDFSVDPERGFFLNGLSMPLRGVSRHQCRAGMGSAITLEEHAEDISLILEMGANTVRLAHYQHAQPFYDLCDETGLVVWAEIPFISVFDPSLESRDNTMSQMEELIAQNYNHVSICFWGIGNELGIGGESEALMDNLAALNELCHRLDPSRLTTLANAGLIKASDRMCNITDVFAFNQYLGWYAGKVEELGPWLDGQHKRFPDRGVGLSEYGAECVMGWHSDTPRIRDYTEEYQALFHEASLQAINERPYLWASYVWNMFDFAAANRDEGGSKGRNNKGLVTFDRKIKKDAFFLYKAHLSDQPFVHITGRRYVQRPQATITVKIYSNRPHVTLSVNGGARVTQYGEKIFLFENVPLHMGQNTLMATADDGGMDVVTLERVAEPNPAYVLPQVEEEISQEVAQWFADLVPQSEELQFPEGYCSVEDEIGDLLAIPDARAALEELLFKPLMMSAGPRMEAGEVNNYLTMMQQMKVSLIYPFISKRLPQKAYVLLNERLNKVKK